MTTGKKTFYCHVAKSMTTKYIYIIPSTVAFLGPWLRERKHSAVTFLCLWLWKKLCSIVTFLGLWLHIKRLKRNTVAFLGLWLWERKQSAVTFFGLWVREKLCSIVTFLGLWLRKEKRSSGSLQWSKESFFKKRTHRDRLVEVTFMPTTKHIRHNYWPLPSTTHSSCVHSVNTKSTDVAVTQTALGYRRGLWRNAVRPPCLLGLVRGPGCTDNGTQSFLVPFTSKRMGALALWKAQRLERVRPRWAEWP